MGRRASTTPVLHPQHLRRNTFTLDKTGLRRNTAVVLPRCSVTVTFDRDDPDRAGATSTPPRPARWPALWVLPGADAAARYQRDLC
jgi:hypothetical protein